MQISANTTLAAALEEAKQTAIKYDSPEIGTEHLLYGILMQNCPASGILKAMGFSGDALTDIFEKSRHMIFDGTPELSTRVKQTLVFAQMESVKRKMPYVNAELVCLLMVKDGGGLAIRMLSASGVDLGKFAAELEQCLASGAGEDGGGSGTGAGAGGAGGFGGAAGGAPKKQLPHQLKNLGVDLTQKAREKRLDPVIGRKEEIERIIQILCRKTKNNPVLIGEPGVGKSAVVEGLAQAVVEGSVPELLKNKTIFVLDVGSVVAGTKYRGELEDRLKNAIETVMKAGDIILFIDELHTLATAGADKGEVTPVDMLKPYLSRGELQTIGATTTDEYRKFIEKDKALERRFQPVMVNPPSVEDTVLILKGLRDNYEGFHKVKITDGAIEAAARLSDRYISDRFLPDKAIDLIDEASSKAKVSGNFAPPQLKEKEEELKKITAEMLEAGKMQDYDRAARLKKLSVEKEEDIANCKKQWAEEREKKVTVITEEDIAGIVAAWTKIPVSRINETEKERLMRLEEILHKRVIGQDEAVVSVAKAIRRARAGLKDPGRPIGTFLFLGPTGVGKTELTKAVAEAMFDDENLIIRLDMSEYMESHSVSKMIGSPPGYVGYDEGGQLTEQVRRKPYSVVLFDEIEKAHPDVFNMLLQILDEGRLTDAQGRVVNFKNTIIVLTSNVGADKLKGAKSVGFLAGADADSAKQSETIMAALKQKFRPEFLNRVDVITVFKSLTKEQIQKIASIMLQKVSKKLAEKNITLTVTPAGMDKLTVAGYDAEFGARPLRRAIEQQIEDVIAEALLTGAVSEGGRITVGAGKDGFTFKYE